MLIDSHCHLDFDALSGDLTDVLGRAGDAGVGAMVTISTRMTTFKNVRSIAEAHKNVWCTVGVHPHEADKEGEVSAQRLTKLAEHPRVIGIGETGLDYYYEHAPREAQRASFRRHIKAARSTGLPVVIHTRDADDDMGAILKKEMEEGVFPRFASLLFLNSCPCPGRSRARPLYLLFGHSDVQGGRRGPGGCKDNAA